MSNITFRNIADQCDAYDQEVADITEARKEFWAEVRDQLPARDVRALKAAIKARKRRRADLDGEEDHDQRTAEILAEIEAGTELANIDTRRRAARGTADLDGVIINVPATAPATGTRQRERGSEDASPSEEGAAIALNASSSQLNTAARPLGSSASPVATEGLVSCRDQNSPGYAAVNADQLGCEGNRLSRRPDRDEGPWTAVGVTAGETATISAHEVASTADKSSDNRQVLDEPSGADPGSAVESGAQISEVAAIAPASAAIAPVELSPSRDVAPGAPPSGEMPDLPAIFDRRSKAA